MDKKPDIKEDKLKPLRPTLRTKKRFIKIDIKSDKKFSFNELSDKLAEEILYFIGAIDFSAHGVWFIKDKFDFNNQIVVIKVSTKLKDKLVSAINLINKIDNNKVSLDVIKVSSTLKGLEK